VIAGVYGMIHDQLTFSISPEYFTKVKFKQFHYADLGLGNRAFVANIGFLATCGVGFVAAWFLARRFIPNQPRAIAYRQIRNGFVCALIFGMLFGVIGFIYGFWRGPNADYFAWEWAVQKYGIKDKWSFVRVAYIHNASYLGGLAGFIVAMCTIRPAHNSDQNPARDAGDEAGPKQTARKGSGDPHATEIAQPTQPHRRKPQLPRRGETTGL